MTRLVRDLHISCDSLASSFYIENFNCGCVLLSMVAEEEKNIGVRLPFGVESFMLGNNEDVGVFGIG